MGPSGSSTATTLDEACEAVVGDLVAAGYALTSIYLFSGRRLRCRAARGYFQVVDGFATGPGVIATVVADGRSKLVADVRQRPDFIAAVPGLVAEACAPVRVGGTVVGAVSVASRTGLGPDDLGAVELAAGALGECLERLGGLPSPSPAQVLSQSSTDLIRERDVVQLERRALATATEMSGMHSAAIARLSDVGPVVSEVTGPLADRIRAWTAAELSALTAPLGPDTSSHHPGDGPSSPDHAFLAEAGVGALSVHPLVTRGRTNGWLIVADTRPVRQPPEDIELLEILAAQTAASMRLAAVLQDGSRQSNQDGLTGLGNRTLLAATTQALLDTRGDTVGRVGLLLLDVDDFRGVNDALGRQAGDRLLVAVADAVRESLREGDLACRIGGDEFVVLMPDVTHGTAITVAERLLSAVSAVSVPDGVEVRVTSSIGIALDTGTGETAEELLRAADLAMYLAKERGKARYALYEPRLREAAVTRLELLSELRKAIRDDALALVYQPIVDLVTGAMTGVEALVRWTSPERGAVSPADFIPLAEETGLIRPLGDWVLREACAQLQLWLAQGVDPRFRMAVNVSTRQLEGGALLEVLDECLENGVAPSQLVLEITETALSLDSGTARATLEAIRARGVQLALDDFGTGYSSLSMLRSSPVSKLKIDRQFVDEITGADADVPIVDATMAMARGLGLGLVAEGVETADQLAYLRNAGCPEGQGYLLARPLPPVELRPLVRGSRPWAELLQSVARRVPEMREQLSGLLDLAVRPDVDLEGLVRPLLDELATMTGLETTYFTRVDPDLTEQVVSVVRAQEDSPLREGLVVPWEDAICRRALSSGPQRTPDVQRTFPESAAAADLGLRAYIVEAVRGTSGDLYGTLCGTSRDPVELSESHAATMRLFARLIGEKVRQLAQPSAGPGREPLPARASDEVLTARRTSLTARRLAGSQAWEAARDERSRAARTELAARPASPEARRRLAVVQAVEQARTAWPAAPCEQQGSGPLHTRRVLVADDDGVMRQLVAAFVGGNPALHLVGAVSTGAAAIGAAVVEQPDVIVLDDDLGDLTADDVVGDLRRFAPAAQIVLHSGRADVAQVGQRLGVDRALYKGDEVERLVEALTALAG